MKQITISTENCETYSSISNFFIDYYMTEANGEFVKVYLYLVRLLNKESNITVAQIADHFNLTENDICRAIKYWIGKDVLRLNYDGRGQLSGIVLLPLSAPHRQADGGWDAISILSIQDAKSEEAKVTKQEAPAVKHPEKQASITPIFPKERPVPEKPKYDIKEAEADKQHDEDWAYIQYQVETLFAKQVSPRDLETLLYIYDTLHFDVALFEYLIEYCVMLNHKNCRYMEAVAIGWYKENITTVTEAKENSQMVTGLLKSIYKELGIRRSYPTNMEMDFIDKWTRTLGFSDELVTLAARKASLTRPGSANFPYINGILEDWHKNKVETLQDVEALDATHAKKQAIEKADRKNAGGNISSFQNFKQTKTDDQLAEMEQLFIKQVGKN